MRVVISKSYLHSSHDLVSALLIHCCKHAWCTYLRLPEQTHGEMSGAPGSASQWQMRHASRLELSEASESRRSDLYGGMPLLPLDSIS